MEHQLKLISLEELQKLAKKKNLKLYHHGGVSAKTEKDFYRSLSQIGLYNLDSLCGFQYILANDEKDYIKNSKIVGLLGCAKHTLLSSFEQDKPYRLLAGDPYEFSGTVIGVYELEYNRYIFIETSWGDFMFAEIIDGQVKFLQILE